MTRSRLSRAIVVAATCGVAGAAVGLSSSAAATNHRAFHGPFGGPGWTRHGDVIHEVTVVPNSSGAFDTLTIDSGKLTLISGDALTITEGTRTATYATPTITVPAGATVYLDGEASALGDLVGGDRVTITQDSDGTTTVVADAGHHDSTGSSGGTGWHGWTGPSGPSGATGWGGRGSRDRTGSSGASGWTGSSGDTGTWRHR